MIRILAFLAALFALAPSQAHAQASVVIYCYNGATPNITVPCSASAFASICISVGFNSPAFQRSIDRHADLGDHRRRHRHASDRRRCCRVERGHDQRRVLQAWRVGDDKRPVHRAQWRLVRVHGRRQHAAHLYYLHEHDDRQHGRRLGPADRHGWRFGWRWWRWRRYHRGRRRRNPRREGRREVHGNGYDRDHTDAGLERNQLSGPGNRAASAATTATNTTGAATSALQTSGNSSLTTIAANTGAAIPDCGATPCTNKIGTVYLQSEYPAGAVPITASATGTTTATTATLAGTSGKTTFICSYSIRANATGAATVTDTVTGVITATMSSILWVAPLASGLGVDEQIFTPCVPASATNTPIAVVSGAPGSGGTVSVHAAGYQL